MDSQGTRILVELRLEESPAFPAQMISGLLDTMSRAIAKAETLQLARIQKEFPEIPAANFDAARFRMRNSAGLTLNVHSARSGSVILDCIASSFGVWFLRQTLGETLKEAWKQSSWHRGLVNFLSSDVKRKAAEIEKNFKPPHWLNNVAQMDISVQPSLNGYVIVVRAVYTGEIVPPPDQSL